MCHEFDGSSLCCLHVLSCLLRLTATFDSAGRGQLTSASTDRATGIRNSYSYVHARSAIVKLPCLMTTNSSCHIYTP